MLVDNMTHFVEHNKQAISYSLLQAESEGFTGKFTLTRFMLSLSL